MSFRRSQRRSSARSRTLARLVCRSVAAAALSLPVAPAGALAEPDPERLAAELDETRSELRQTKDELAATRDLLQRLSRKVDALEAAQPAAASASEPGATARLAPVNADNPAISFVVDTLAYSNSFRDPTNNTLNKGNGFDLQDAELFVSAPIDPFLRGYATIAASSQEGFDIEEAALVTTALPWNLAVRGGRFFADVGRFSSYHPEALPFVDRPPSIDRMIGGESSAEGVEISWLAPLPVFAQLTVGAYNSIGAERREDPDAFGFPTEVRSFSELTYLARPLFYLDVTDAFSMELGGTYFTVPRDRNRSLYGLDLTLRHQPGSQGFYQGTTVGTEWMWNDERYPDVNPVLDPITGLGLVDEAGAPILAPGRYARNGGYAYFESFFFRQYSVGMRFDYAEDVAGPTNRLITTSAFLTWMPSEFHRLRFQFDNFNGNGSADERYTLQWTAFIGSHSHGFQNRAR
jgi:hypothetical protein